jgi:hypothetical protein
MGSMIQRLEIDWGKNRRFNDDSALFQASDVTDGPYYYAGSEKTDEIEPGEKS